jgi:hypothetical protein
MDLKYLIAAADIEVGVLLGLKNAAQAGMTATLWNVCHYMENCCFGASNRRGVEI